MANLLLPKRWGVQKPPLGSQLDSGHPLAQGLLAQWLFNEGGGNQFRDSASHLYHLTNTLSTVTWDQGRGGPALASAATASGTILTKAKTIPTLSAFTVETWIKPTTGTQDGYGCLITQGGSKGFFYRSTNKIDFFTGADHNSSATFATGVWSQAAVTFDAAGNWAMYVNGRLDSSGSVSPNTYAFDSVLNDTGTETFVGGMESLRLWTRVLTAGEIQRLYVDPYAPMVAQSPRRRLWITPSGAAQALAGATAGTSGASGSLRVTHSLAGTTAGVSTDTAALKVAHSLAGSTSGTSTDSAAIKVAHSLTGSTTGTSGLTGGIIEADHLGGTINGVGNAAGTLNVAHALTGTSSGTSTAGPADIRCARALTGTISGQATCTASLQQSLALAGTSTGISTVAGGIRVAYTLGGTTNGISTLTGGLNFIVPDLNPLHFTYQEPSFAVTYTESSTIEHREPATSFVYQEH